MVKFGSWDTKAANSQMTMLSTANGSSWGIMTQSAYFGREEFDFNFDFRTVILEPKYPYIYLPSADWIQFKKALLK